MAYRILTWRAKEATSFCMSTNEQAGGADPLTTQQLSGYQGRPQTVVCSHQLQKTSSVQRLSPCPFQSTQNRTQQRCRQRVFWTLGSLRHRAEEPSATAPASVCVAVVLQWQQHADHPWAIWLHYCEAANPIASSRRQMQCQVL